MAQIELRVPSRGAGSPALFRNVITIGRSRVNDIVLHGISVSRTHAEVRFAGGRWCVLDLDSRNGTYLNGKLVRREAALFSGDQIRIGEIVINFEAVADMTAGPLVHGIEAPAMGRTPPSSDQVTVTVDAAAVLYERIVTGGETFREAVLDPLSKGELPMEAVRRLVARGLAESGDSIPDLARLFRAGPDERALEDIIKQHGIARGSRGR